MEVFGVISVLLFFLFFGIIGILSTIFWIWMLIDCVTKETDEGNSRLIWVLVIVLTHLIGALIYCFVRKIKRI
ncbi:MAG: PLDc N-terminal domain-containing protein [bacterium]|nr:PLDc N-terminal domain-containing protein [bacterium]